MCCLFLCKFSVAVWGYACMCVCMRVPTAVKLELYGHGHRADTPNMDRRFPVGCAVGVYPSEICEPDSISSAHFRPPPPLSISSRVTAAAENGGQIWGDHNPPQSHTHTAIDVCVRVQLGKSGKSSLWCSSKLILCFLPSISNYHGSKWVKIKNSNKYMQKKRARKTTHTHMHTHVSTRSQRSHYHYNWTERRDYVQIKIRMHTNKYYSRLSLCHSWQILRTQPKGPTFIC